MKRIRVGLRLMLLLVALFAVVFAWLGARRELHRTDLRGRLRGLEIQREYAAGRVNDPEEGAHWRRAVSENDDMIASLREQLGESKDKGDRKQTAGTVSGSRGLDAL
jgi:hypothetical protein